MNLIRTVALLLLWAPAAAFAQTGTPATDSKRSSV